MEGDRKGEQRMTDWNINSNRDDGEIKWEMGAEEHG